MIDCSDAFPAPATLATVARRLRGARRVVALTGAGVSAESGVPTFRDAQTGMWARFDPLELATPTAFARDPRLVWDWYAWRRAQLASARPNPGHLALAAIESQVPEFLLVTQNVDGLHRAAGSARIVELHGNIGRVKCSRGCGSVATWDDAGERRPPRCAHCGAFLRPDVIWFDEVLPEEAHARARQAAQACDLMLVVGTSAEVQPAAALPDLAHHGGAIVVEVNLAPTPLSAGADHVLRGAAGVVLPALVAAGWPAPA